MTLRQHLSRHPDHGISLPHGTTSEFVERIHRMDHKSLDRRGEATHGLTDDGSKTHEAEGANL